MSDKLHTWNHMETRMRPVENVRDLGLILDNHLTLRKHVSSIVRICHFHLRTLSKLRPFLTRQAANSIAVALVLSRLDYCNSCLWGLPGRELKRLQLVQNTAARIVTRTKKHDHITPVLRDLHWLPFKKSGGFQGPYPGLSVLRGNVSGVSDRSCRVLQTSTSTEVVITVSPPHPKCIRLWEKTVWLQSFHQCCPTALELPPNES